MNMAATKQADVSAYPSSDSSTFPAAIDNLINLAYDAGRLGHRWEADKDATAFEAYRDAFNKLSSAEAGLRNWVERILATADDIASQAGYAIRRGAFGRRTPLADCVSSYYKVRLKSALPHDTDCTYHGARPCDLSEHGTTLVEDTKLQCGQEAFVSRRVIIDRLVAARYHVTQAEQIARAICEPVSINPTSEQL